MKKFAYILFLLLYSCASNIELKEGDILFQDLDSGPLCEAIEQVTPGYNNANLSHIGLIVSINGELKVLEAIPPKVLLTNIDEFLNRSNKVIVGRLKPEFRKSIEYAVEFAKQQLGKEYDDAFLMNNESYYCSELIYRAFEKNNIFKLEPMTFRNPKNGETLEVWGNYYEKIGIDIPEGEPGINPGIMSLSEKIEIIHTYRAPEGMHILPEEDHYITPY